jgi:hypothetical protein
MGDWKALRLNVQRNPNPPTQLFDLKEDIGETTNVAAKHPEVVEKMRELMETSLAPSDHPRWNF